MAASTAIVASLSSVALAAPQTAIAAQSSTRRSAQQQSLVAASSARLRLAGVRDSGSNAAALKRSQQSQRRSSSRALTRAVAEQQQAAQSSSSSTSSSPSTTIQFIRGIDEPCIPDVRLTRSRDGSNGSAIFLFDQPAVFEAAGELGDITGMYIIDEEGELSTVDVSAKFVNGKPTRIEARLALRNTREWDRFMRFMNRFAEENGLGFSKK
eukprot:jgi/Chlat1/1952/Chrsp157S00784